MNDIQQNELKFYLPVVISYALACLLYLFILKKINRVDQDNPYIPRKPWLELPIGLTAAAVLIILGRLYSAGYLLPSSWGQWTWTANNMIIYCPIFLMTGIRKQPFSTFFISKKNLHIKLGLGVIIALLSVVIFIGLRQEWERLDEILIKSISPEAINYFMPVFLEGVAIAYLFVRLKWVSNLKIALIIPSVLFALVHVPGMIENHASWYKILTMSAVTGTICAFVLYTSNKTKDIIVIGIVHYFMDVAIRVF